LLARGVDPFVSFVAAPEISMPSSTQYTGFAVSDITYLLGTSGGIVVVEVDVVEVVEVLVVVVVAGGS